MNLTIKKIIDLYIGGFLILVLRPITIVVGKFLRRNHSPIPRGDITVIKLLGGGSLVIAASALLAIKKKYPQHKLQIITTPSGPTSLARSACSTKFYSPGPFIYFVGY